MTSIIAKYNDKRYWLIADKNFLTLMIWTGDPKVAYYEKLEITDTKITFTFRGDTREIIGSGILKLFAKEIEELKEFPERPVGEKAEQFAKICETIYAKVRFLEEYSS